MKQKQIEVRESSVLPENYERVKAMTLSLWRLARSSHEPPVIPTFGHFLPRSSPSGFLLTTSEGGFAYDGSRGGGNGVVGCGKVIVVKA